MDEFISMRLWNIFIAIEKEVNLKKKGIIAYIFFVDSTTVLIKCDQRLSVKLLYYFEDVIIDFEMVILTANDMFYSYEYYIKANVIEAKCYWKNKLHFYNVKTTRSYNFFVCSDYLLVHFSVTFPSVLIISWSV